MQSKPHNILILGASYGLLPGIKLSLAGHYVTCVGTPKEIAAIKETGLAVTIPLRKSSESVVLRVPVGECAKDRKIALLGTEAVNASQYDFVILAMQEPHYAGPGISALMASVALTQRPCLSIMNLPPRPFLKRIQAIPETALNNVYTSNNIWQGFDPRRVSAASPDPQAFRVDPARPGHLTVSLASNFKAAPFEDEDDTLILQKIADDMTHVQIEHNHTLIRPPIMMTVRSSLFAPLSKWPMLIAGNFRCFGSFGLRSIAEAIFADEVKSRRLYDAVCRLLNVLGASENELVSFEQYRKAATMLTQPSSVARALSNGAKAVERLDRLILNLMRHYNLPADEVEAIVETVESRLMANRH